MDNESNKYQYNPTKALLAIIITELIFWGIALICYRYIQWNVKEFRFEHPLLLWSFLFIPVIIAIWSYNRKWKNNSILKYASIKTLPNIFLMLSKIPDYFEGKTMFMQ